LTVCAIFGDAARKTRERDVNTGKREQEIYKDEIVTVTTTRAILGGTTYAVANITSVRQLQEPGALGVVMLGLALAVVGGALLDFLGSTAVALALGGVAIAIGGLIVRKPRHWVLVGTAGAESRAIFSYDKSWTTSVVEALNQAIIDRG
jgi:hypothetical protein